MKLVKQIKVKPETKEVYRGKNFKQMKDPNTNQPLNEHSTITMKELENKNIMIFETRPHANFKAHKKAMFQSTKFYYEEV